MDWKEYSEYLSSFNFEPPHLLPEKSSPVAARKEHYDLYFFTRDGLTEPERKLLVFCYRHFWSCFSAYSLAIGDPIDDVPVADENLSPGGPPVTAEDRDGFRRWMMGARLDQEKLDDFSSRIYNYETWAEAFCEVADQQLSALSLRVLIDGC